jgi:hypothetical protein
MCCFPVFTVYKIFLQIGLQLWGIAWLYCRDCGEPAGSIFRVSTLKRDAAGLSEKLPKHPAPIWCHGSITVVEKVFRFVSPVKRYVSYMNIFWDALCHVVTSHSSSPTSSRIRLRNQLYLQLKCRSFSWSSHFSSSVLFLLVAYFVNLFFFLLSVQTYHFCLLICRISLAFNCVICHVLCYHIIWIQLMLSIIHLYVLGSRLWLVVSPKFHIYIDIVGDSFSYKSYSFGIADVFYRRG